MSPIRNKILQLFRSKKLNVFVLFFIISLTILILSKLSQNYQGTLVFKVKPTNIKETQVILNDSSNQLNITLDTYGFKWLRYAVSKPIVEVDLESDVILKDSILIWTEKKGFSNISKQFGKDIKVININPDSLVFRYNLWTNCQCCRRLKIYSLCYLIYTYKIYVLYKNYINIFTIYLLL